MFHADPVVGKFYGPDGLLEMIAQCDYVVATAPLTAETRGMIGAREFAAMKPGAVVINVGRGAVIDEDPLYAALADGRLGGAAIDVWWQYPSPDDPTRRGSRHPFHDRPPMPQ